MRREEVIKDLKNRADTRYNEFKIIEQESISNIQEDSYILKPNWLWGDTNYTVAMIDLNDSTQLSLKKYKKTIARLYDYFTQSAFDCFNHEWYADYIDIRWDWVFAIFEWEKQLERAFIAITTFRRFFKEYVNTKFNAYEEALSCKCAIYQDTMLVRRLGNKKYQNEVWAWRLITLCSKLIWYPKEKKLVTLSENNNRSYLVVSDAIYDYYKKYHENYIIKSCECKGSSNDLWKEYHLDSDFKLKYDVQFAKIHILNAIWCDTCWQGYIDEILS